jgi:hypothetical protein
MLSGPGKREDTHLQDRRWELLSNGAKHAEAQNVALLLRIGEGKLRLDYTDNGRGFDPERAASEMGEGTRGDFSAYGNGSAFRGEGEDILRTRIWNPHFVPDPS